MSKKDKQAPQEKPQGKTKAPLVVERVSVDELRLDPRNARLHPERNLTAIRASLERFGQQKPIVVKKDGTVVAGNGTLEVARQLGWTHVDVVRTELDGAAAAAFAVADNRTGELSEWDPSALEAALAAYGADDLTADLALTFASLGDVEVPGGEPAAGDGDPLSYAVKVVVLIHDPKLRPEVTEAVLAAVAAWGEAVEVHR